MWHNRCHKTATEKISAQDQRTPGRRRRYLLAAASLVTALATLPLLRMFDMANLAMLFVLALMLVAGLIAGRLTARPHVQARVAEDRAARSNALYEFARALSSALLTEQVFEITRDAVQRAFDAHATLLLPDAQGRLQYPPVPGCSGMPAMSVPVMSVFDVALAQ